MAFPDLSKVRKSSVQFDLFLDSISSPPLVLTVLFTTGFCIFLALNNKNSIKMTTAIMKEYLSRIENTETLRGNRNIFLLKSLVARVNLTTRICYAFSFTSYDRQ